MATKWYTYSEIQDRIANDIRVVHPGMDQAFPGAALNLATYIMENALGEVFHDMQGRSVAASSDAIDQSGGRLTEV